MPDFNYGDPLSPDNCETCSPASVTFVSSVRICRLRSIYFSFSFFFFFLLCVCVCVCVWKSAASQFLGNSQQRLHAGLLDPLLCISVSLVSDSLNDMASPTAFYLKKINFELIMWRGKLCDSPLLAWFQNLWQMTWNYFSGAYSLLMFSRKGAVLQMALPLNFSDTDKLPNEAPLFYKKCKWAMFLPE